MITLKQIGNRIAKYAHNIERYVSKADVREFSVCMLVSYFAREDAVRRVPLVEGVHPSWHGHDEVKRAYALADGRHAYIAGFHSHDHGHTEPVFTAMIREKTSNGFRDKPVDGSNFSRFFESSLHDLHDHLGQKTSAYVRIPVEDLPC